MKKIFLLLVVCLGSLFYFYTPARLWLWYTLGRTQNCTRESTPRAADELTTQVSKKDQILAASKLLETDPKGYKLYDTPDGKYWIPKGSEYTLPYNLAEQARDIYGWSGHGVKSGDVVLDCGANIGVYTRLA